MENLVSYMSHEMMGRERDEIGGASLEDTNQIPDLEALPSGDK